ncbi:membrane-associating domain-containing protein [Xylariaceae sp. FL0255]|nr:membrane-associating domain-containing protein [Xylariaceae sp. FL0255]
MASFASIAHIVAGVFTIVELGLTAYLVTPYDSFSGSAPYYSVIAFLLFTSVWSLLVLFYVGLTPLYMTSIFHRLAAFVLNVLTAIFWFAGAIALAVDVGAPRCGSDHYCGSAEAAVAFAFFLWVLFTFLAVLDGIESLRRRGHHVQTKQNTNAYPGA